MNDRTPAQERFDFLINMESRKNPHRKNALFTVVMERAEEVATEVTGIAEQLATLHESVYEINKRLDKLEPAKPTTSDDDPVCETCQHQRSSHNEVGCFPQNGDFGILICPCKAFVPVTAPEPDDPICQRPGCGHKRSDHDYERNQIPNACSQCWCGEFLLTYGLKP